MKRHILLLLILAVGISCFSQEKEHQLTIKITGKFPKKGNLRVHIYDTPKDFLKKPLQTIVIPVKEFKDSAVFNKITQGDYAIFVVNDENENNRLDKNWIGMPKEAMGCSNGAKGGMFGPPKFKDAQFKVKKDTTVVVKIKKIFR